MEAGTLSRIAWMDDPIEALIIEIQAAVEGLARGPEAAAEPGRLADLSGRFVGWRRVVSAQQEGSLRDRAMWALLGAERYLKGAREIDPVGVDPSAARLRLEAAVRALRAMHPMLEVPPEPG
jgi:hypothetical protein